MKNLFLAELEKAKQLPYVSDDTYKSFTHLLRTHNAPLRQLNNPHHICSFFLPVHIATRSVYLVHHKKAGSWIPPGGHIDPGETPRDTVQREFREELSFSLSDEPVGITHLTMIPIVPPRAECKTHYDFWYAVLMHERSSFSWDKNEFYDADWFTLEEALKKMTYELYRNALREMATPLFAS